MINIDEEIKNALKSHSSEVNVLRLIKAEILKYKTAKNAKEYNDDAELQLLRKMAKQRRESIEMYENADRTDLVDKERFELEVICQYIPESPSEEMIKLYLIGLPYATFDPITGEYPINKKDMGKIIKDLKTQFPTADGADLSRIVKSYIE